MMCDFHHAPHMYYLLYNISSIHTKITYKISYIEKTSVRRRLSSYVTHLIYCKNLLIYCYKNMPLTSVPTYWHREK